MKFTIAERKKFIFYSTKILRKLSLIFIVALLIELVLGYINSSWITMNLLTNQFYVGFSAIFLWVFFNMLTSYHEVGEFVLNSEDIVISNEVETIYKLEELKNIYFEINEYEGQAYGPLSSSTYQGINNYFKFTDSNKQYEYKFLIKNKKSLNSLANEVCKWRHENIDVKMYYNGVERYDFESV
ncbi:MAG: hypothetical protein HOD63_15860 [Bacteroidetes bacterium]|jgi:hypothetical protein|nr:hypothetical protein [Bacteroidota bacterium]MBT5527658.1 hypothetical protein [Cytophagia bacterium]MBT3801519.1 hypothetical protein [Bacteroidota bacterium]MBT4340066.1 hypothetical protein [Bacteroidota bacterium]MBT4729760.1 hypothetical protein [Bacteroidota bacterium]